MKDAFELEAASTKSKTEHLRSAFAVVALLGLSPNRDGDQWCFL